MDYGSMSDELYIVLKEQGITSYPPQNENETHARIDIVFEGALDERFEVDLRENDVRAIVDGIFEHITSRDYAKGCHVLVDVYESNGDDYNEPLYERQTPDE